MPPRRLVREGPGAHSEDYKLFTDLAPVGMFLSTTDGRFLWVNRALAEIFGYDSPDAVLANVTNIAEDIYDDPALREGVVEAVRQNPKHARFSHVYRRRDGSRFQAHLNLSLSRDEDGRPFLIGTIEDVTELEQALADLRESEERFHAIFDYAPLGIYQSTPEGEYRLVNPKFAELFGYSSPRQLLEEVKNAENLYLDPAQRLEMLEILEEEDSVLEFESVAKRRDGSTFIAQRAVRAIRENGRITRLKGFVQDVTKRRELERQREDVDRLVRHDLRSPVVSFQAGLRLLRSDDARLDKGEVLDHLERNCDQMLRLLDLSRDVGKMERGEFRLNSEAVDLSDLVGEAAECAAESCFGVEVKLPEDCRLSVSGDRTLLFCLFENLLRNAVEASEPGREVRVEAGDEEGLALVTVANPTPVPESLRDCFFDKYATYGKSHGTGLGTYWARLIADAHHGGIELDTGDEQGTRVTVKLPQWQGDDPLASPLQPR
ncbi:PAS domain-containing sensor histidine kinase [Desulfohalovibrio reitneri]|uniref:PAS domain-containing sensor histidine kinase n=1 Tax=Desulfohalovibrio reitneri TaxID=1307759 RepID=UPI0004A75960|nr:PAS domain-containing sensor histidine kinase [Desulfohalovibrio reitneri]